MSTQNSKKGFTLIELMVVIVIIGILAAIAIPKLFGMTAKAKAQEVPIAAGTWTKLQQAYIMEIGKVGSFAKIGYIPPGGNADDFKCEPKGGNGSDKDDCKDNTTKAESSTQFFKYTGTNTGDETAVWKAEATADIGNGCMKVGATGDNVSTGIWTATHTSGNSIATMENAAGDCGKLTPGFNGIGIPKATN
jgi:prepilin-type N-terminal cleavage/methylation domain-containing protein